MKPLDNVSIVVAVTSDNAIGRGGDLVYRLRGDMRRFRELTTGHTIVMGRKTWESLPKGALPNRRNIVVTRNDAYQAPGAEVFNSLDEALANVTGEIFIIGGAQIYAEAMPVAQRLYITHIEAEAPDADTFFPALNLDQWVVKSAEPFAVDDETGLKYRFVCLSRK